MLARNPARMDYSGEYEEIIADYNREKDRATIEETFAKLVELADRPRCRAKARCRGGLERRRVGSLNLLFKENISKTERRAVEAGE